MTNKLKNIALTYLLLFVFGYLAKREVFGVNLDFLWIVYLPIATYISIITFDMLTNYIDFETIHDLKQEHKASYTVALAILSAGFAVATAIFMR
jgi:hypothetical protein